MNRIRFLLIAVLLLLSSSARANFTVIDSFTNPNPSTFFLVNPSGSNVNPLTLTHATGSGSTRAATMRVDVPNPLPPGVNALNGVIGFENLFNTGVLAFNSNTFTQARAILNYSSFTGTSGNFYNDGIPMFLYLRFLNLDPGINLSTNGPAADIPVDIAISTTGGSLAGSFFIPQSDIPFDYQIPLSSLIGVADLSQVTDITVTLNGGPDQRQRVDFLLQGFTLETFPVPAPPALFVALAGLPLLLRLSRRR